jgi:hypothetical protein
LPVLLREAGSKKKQAKMEAGREIRNPQSAIRNGIGGQATVETLFAIPLLLMMMFGAFQIARVYYTYHTLQKAVRGGAGLLAHTSNVNYCGDPNDPVLLTAKNFIVYGNLQGTGDPIVTGLTTDSINFYAERVAPDSTEVDSCLCDDPSNSCDISAGGRPPDFITVNLGPGGGGGFPIAVPFPFLSWTTINLKVSVRMPVTGG